MINHGVLILGEEEAERAVKVFHVVGFGQAGRVARLNMDVQGFPENTKWTSVIMVNRQKRKKTDDDAGFSLPQHSHKAAVLTFEHLISVPLLVVLLHVRQVLSVEIAEFTAKHADVRQRGFFPVSFKHTMTLCLQADLIQLLLNIWRLRAQRFCTTHDGPGFITHHVSPAFLQHFGVFETLTCLH